MKNRAKCILGVFLASMMTLAFSISVAAADPSLLRAQPCPNNCGGRLIENWTEDRETISLTPHTIAGVGTHMDAQIRITVEYQAECTECSFFDYGIMERYTITECPF